MDRVELLESEAESQEGRGSSGEKHLLQCSSTHGGNLKVFRLFFSATPSRWLTSGSISSRGPSTSTSSSKGELEHLPFIQGTWESFSELIPRLSHCVYMRGGNSLPPYPRVLHTYAITRCERKIPHKLDLLFLMISGGILNSVLAESAQKPALWTSRCVAQ